MSGNHLMAHLGGAVAFLLFAMAFGCEPHEMPDVDGRIVVGQSFEADSAERKRIQSLLRRVFVSKPSPDSFMDGQIYRFGGKGRKGRYLLARSEVLEEGDQPVIVLYVLESGVGRQSVSTPFYTGIVDHP